MIATVQFVSDRFVLITTVEVDDEYIIEKALEQLNEEVGDNLTFNSFEIVDCTR